MHVHHVDGKTSQALANFPDAFDSRSLNALLALLDRYTVYPGHPDKHLVDMLPSMKGKLTARHGELPHFHMHQLSLCIPKQFDIHHCKWCQMWSLRSVQQWRIQGGDLGEPWIPPFQASYTSSIVV